MARIYDNIEIKFEQGLTDIIESHGVKRVDFCVGYFNLRGWDKVVEQVERLEGDSVFEGRANEHRTCRLLIGMHQPPTELVRMLYSNEDNTPDAELVQKIKRRIAQDFRDQLLIGISTKHDEWSLRRLSAQLKSRKVIVKLSVKEPLHAKLYLAFRPNDRYNPILAIMGSSNLTYAGLTKQGELNAEFQDRDQAEKLSRWFDDRWNDNFCVDITDELIKAIDESWASERLIPPYYVYLKIAYHLSEEARNGIKEFTLSPIFQRELFDFQQNAVKIVARYLNNDKRRGAMIGDVVGLGKTITACAVAKIYETTFAGTTLIICPANLQEMWRKYIVKYDLKAEVTSMSKPIDVEKARFYRLIIVDESHNLRNGGKRYQNIKNLIEHQSSRVLLLTATPYNKHYSDLANQLRLFIADDQDLGIRPERYIESLGGERGFQMQHSDIPIRTIGAFQKSEEVEDWNELMKLFLVRRTRSFIRNNFAKSDDRGKYLQFPDGSKSYFPDRIPRSIKFNTVSGDQYSHLYSSEMIGLMESLALPRYGLNNFIGEKNSADAPKHIQTLIDNLSRAGVRMMGFCKSTFFKRMDSSGFSFLLTLYRHILRNCVYIYALDNKLPVPIGDDNALPEDDAEDENFDNDGNVFDKDGYEPAVDATFDIPTDINEYMRKAKSHYDLISQKDNISWLDAKFFKRSLKQQLKADCDTILKMIHLCGRWEQQQDQKLNELEQLLRGTHPIYNEHGTDKVVIFTQYSDTARYIFYQLRKRGFTNIDFATGGSDNPSVIVEKFSPLSNDAAGKYPVDKQTRILIATDVLSEGHNLQDAHVIVNYDLPWAIIRLIQRAGRVDRIGQKADKIFCYSFFPADGVEKIINLRGRLNDRINANANIVGSDEVFFEGNEQNLRDMFNEKSGVLDEADDGDVDLASQAYQIWSNAIKADKRLKEIIPQLQNMIYATKLTGSRSEQGVVTYTRTANEFDVLTWLDLEGNVISQSQQRIMQVIACHPDTPCAESLEKHHELVADAIEKIKEQTASNTGGVLGNRFSTRYRIVDLLNHYYDQPASLFFNGERREELKYAIDDIYNYPLQSNAKFNIGRMLKNSGRSADDDIVDYVLELRRNGQLCIITDDDTENKENQIICSMGLRYEP